MALYSVSQATPGSTAIGYRLYSGVTTGNRVTTGIIEAFSGAGVFIGDIGETPPFTIIWDQNNVVFASDDIGNISGIWGQVQKLQFDGSNSVKSAPQTIALRKNQPLANFGFVMMSSVDHVTPVAGLTVTATRSIDGASFAACANNVAEVGNGAYKISLDASDLNGDTITLRATAPGVDTLFVEFITTA